MEFKRGRWSKKWVNCPEDKRDYDFMQRGFMRNREDTARMYCDKWNIPDITGGEKKEILTYWAQYGIDIYDFSWHKMYYAVTGMHDPRFVPDIVAGLVVYEYYNDKEFESTWRDKNMFDRLLPNVPLPQTCAKCVRNRFYFGGRYYTRDESSLNLLGQAVVDGIGGSGAIIIKDTRTTGHGRDVKRYVIREIRDVLVALNYWEKSENFIIQKCVQQHDAFARFNESSTNMMRVCSWRHGNNVEILYAVARAGVPGQVTDTAYINGTEVARIVAISEDGIFDDKMLDQDGHVVCQFERGERVPAWNQIVDIVKMNHLLVDNFDIIGWDFTVDTLGKPYCFEWNIQWPGTVYYQFAQGPLFGKYTEDVLSFLKSEYNKYNYIPIYMKVKNNTILIDKGQEE